MTWPAAHLRLSPPQDKALEILELTRGEVAEAQARTRAGAAAAEEREFALVAASRAAVAAAQRLQVEHAEKIGEMRLEREAALQAQQAEWTAVEERWRCVPPSPSLSDLSRRGL